MITARMKVHQVEAKQMVLSRLTYPKLKGRNHVSQRRNGKLLLVCNAYIYVYCSSESLRLNQVSNQSLHLPAFFCLVFSFVMATASLSLVHERLPDRKTYGPLPDIFFEFMPQVDWALGVSEIIIMVSSNVTLLIMLFHKHR